jgi:hypothetical protein
MLIEQHFGGAPVYAAHGACYLCRTAPDGVWVKTGIDIVGEGELVFCGQCAKEVGIVIGLEDPERRARIENALAESEERARSLQTKADAFDIFCKTYESSRDLPPARNVPVKARSPK